MIIIYGLTSRKDVVNEGTFDCPQCGRERQGKHIRHRQYIALFLIPVFPLSKGDEYIECEFCLTRCDPICVQFNHHRNQ
jgi:hypothetical protein